MADWTICPSCQLKHSMRNDGLCPRCHQPVDAGAPAGGALAMAAPPLPQQHPSSPPYTPPAKASPVKWVVIAVVAIVVVLGLQGLGSISGRQMLFKVMYDLQGEPVTRIDGRRLPYRMTFASANKWYLRSEASARGDNAEADRWLVCPEKNAHVITIVEEVHLEEGQYLDMGRAVDLVIENMRKNVAKYTVHRTAYISKPIGGRQVHGTAEVKGVEVELYHAVLIDGNRIYQVLAFSEKKYFPEMKGELEQVIQTMRLP